MAELNINKAEFIKSAAAPSGFIRDALPNIVFPASQMSANPRS